MLSRILKCAALLLCTAVVLCGCSIFTADTDELLNPPELSGALKPIENALKKSVSGDYTLKYPTNGSFRSAFVRNDINGDGILEAFCFYSTQSGDTVTLHINMITNEDGKWKSTAEQKITAGGVDRVDFCDLDGDGVEEILVGWEIYGTSEMQLAVYSYSKGELAQRMLQRYTYFLCCDLDEDSKEEILLINYNSSESTNYAGLYKLNGDGVNEVAGCQLDGTVKSVNEPILSTLSNGRRAVYIDEVKGAGAITEVVFMEKGVLVNPLLNPETRENLVTLRSSSISCRDINGDNIIEIPIQEFLPAAGGTTDSLYYTNWCSFNGETLTKQQSTVLNYNDGYYMIIPTKWVGKLAFSKDIDNRVRGIYSYDPETQTVGEQMAYIQTFDLKDWENGEYKKFGLTEITHINGMVYACFVADPEAIKVEEIKQNFRIYE